MLLIAATVVQMQVYVIQETAEALAGGLHLDAAWLLSMLGWGLAGQLPVACLAALCLPWLSIRFDLAMAGLRSLWQPSQTHLRHVAVVVTSCDQVAGPVAWMAQAAPVVLVKRGPPLLPASV